jgi:tetratricopeptide (TPR) repeat protein
LEAKGRWREAEGVFREVAENPQAGSWLRGAALNGLGVVYDSQGRWDEAIECYEKALGFFQDLGDRHGRA